MERSLQEISVSQIEFKKLMIQLNGSLIQLLEACNQLSDKHLSFEKRQSKCEEEVKNTYEDLVIMQRQKCEESEEVITQIQEVARKATVAVSTNTNKTHQVIAEMSRMKTEITQLKEKCAYIEEMKTHLMNISVIQKFCHEKTEKDIATLKPVPHGEYLHIVSNVKNLITFWRMNPLEHITAETPTLGVTPQGYRYKMKMYINGVAEEFGTYVGCSIVMVNGPYDHVLKWPLNALIEISILSPRLRQNDKKKSILTSDYLYYFQRPIGEEKELRIGQMLPVADVMRQGSQYTLEDKLVFKFNIKIT